MGSVAHGARGRLVVLAVITAGVVPSLGRSSDDEARRRTVVRDFPQGELRLTYDADTRVCSGDYFFPLVPSETLLSPGMRTVLYILALIYAFVGVSIIADIFMSSIEVITSKKRTVVINGEAITVRRDRGGNKALDGAGSHHVATSRAGPRRPSYGTIPWRI